jgi:SAM-dependent methyltransferase
MKTYSPGRLATRGKENWKASWMHAGPSRGIRAASWKGLEVMPAETVSDKCFVCSAQGRFWASVNTPHGKFRIVRCAECGVAFVNPRPTSEFISSFYSTCGHGSPEERTLERVLEDERKYPNSTLDAQRIVENIHRFLMNGPCEERRSLLDIGCGYGFFSREARLRGFDVTALEVAAEERGIAMQIAGLRPLPISFEAFECREDSFSALLMSQILEHALDVNLWIAKAHRLLAPAGILALALPNFGSFLRFLMREKEPYICPPAHLNFFTIKGLSMLLRRHGFHVLKAESVSRIDSDVVMRRAPFSRVLGRNVLRLATKCCFSPFDSMGLGMMINLYARKQPLTR